VQRGLRATSSSLNAQPEPSGQCLGEVLADDASAFRERILARLSRAEPAYDRQELLGHGICSRGRRDAADHAAHPVVKLRGEERVELGIGENKTRFALTTNCPVSTSAHIAPRSSRAAALVKLAAFAFNALPIWSYRKRSSKHRFGVTRKAGQGFRRALAAGASCLFCRTRVRRCASFPCTMISMSRFVALVALGLLSCRRSEPSQATHRAGEPERLVLRYETQVGAVSPAEIAEDLGYLAPVRLEHVGMSTGGPHSLRAVLTGDVDFGASFNGAIIKVVASWAPLKAVVASYGSDAQSWLGHYVLDDSPIKSARDLLGKHVAMNTVGTHMEFVLREYLHRQGISPDDAKQVTLVAVPPVSTEQLLRQRQVEVAALSSVFKDRALAKGGLRLLFSESELLGEFTAGAYFMLNAFLRDHPATARKFATGVGKAIEWLRTAPRAEVVARMEAILSRRHEDTSAVQYWKSVGVPARSGVLRDSDQQVWIDWLVREGQLTPGQIAPRDVYTNEYNDAAAVTAHVQNGGSQTGLIVREAADK
jgi:ABC-type nitrate/sulfonate/bicarbonate transport system substrate-binding protein